MKHLYFLTFLSLLSIFTCQAQVDTEFWFVAPDVTSGHGDRPVYLRISTLNENAQVRVLQPARQNRELANVMVNANTTRTIDLSVNIHDIETNVPASVMKSGIRVVSTSPVTAYYEVGSAWNADIFALKGKNALGNKFVIPAQNYYNNSSDYSPTPFSSFDIVATKNNTLVKIRPSRSIYGHVGENVITVKLNAGETYSFRKTTLLASDNPAGTIVESNKPIAVTIKDDSVINGGCRDLLGDQLVPVEVAGYEYVVLKGFLDTPEFLFVTATEDNTEIHIAGSNTPTTVLDAGEVFRYQISSQSTFISASKVIYVFHVTGFGCELGMAILPSINCKGSQQIGFSRTTSEFFGLNVLVRKEGIGSFTLNGSSSLVSASAFSPVPGTNDQWYAAQLSFSTSQIFVGQASLISNDQRSFQIGIINGNASTTCRYGYFSAFSTLFIGDDFTICEGETATLDAGPGKESYLWNTGETTQSINISDPGQYWVRADREECILYDTIQVDVKKGSINLGPDVAVCDGDTAFVDGKDNFSWLWSDSTTHRFLEATQPGKYWLSIIDNNGCQASDTVLVSGKDSPTIDLGTDIVKCPTEEILLDATFPGATYAWENGSTEPTRMVRDSGEYRCTVFYNGCQATDEILVTHLPGPEQDSIFGSPSVCPFVNEVAYAVEDVDGSSYTWFVEGGDIVTEDGHRINVNWKNANAAAAVKALVTNELGCVSDTLVFPVRINVNLEVEIPDGPDTLCFNTSDQVIYTTPETNGSVYDWKIAGGAITSGQGSHEIVVDWEEGLNSLWIEESSTTVDTVCRGVSPELSVFVFKDPADIQLNFVSVDTVSEQNIRISWTVSHPERIATDSVKIYKRPDGNDSWQLFRQVSTSQNLLIDEGNFTDDVAYEYRIGAENLCAEGLLTRIHNSIRLTGEADTLKDVIRLNWNPYEGWLNGVEKYEVWRKLDETPGFEFLMETEAESTSVEIKNAEIGFHHEYLVKAVEKSGSRDSWSNQVEFDFEHPVSVPNVFTPNGDGFNQYFYISKIELYSQSELQVMDRWGRKVYKAKGYKNDWDGDGLSTGVYYYVLDLKRDDKVLKGTVSILR